MKYHRVTPISTCVEPSVSRISFGQGKLSNPKRRAITNTLDVCEGQSPRRPSPRGPRGEHQGNALARHNRNRADSRDTGDTRSARIAHIAVSDRRLRLTKGRLGELRPFRQAALFGPARCRASPFHALSKPPVQSGPHQLPYTLPSPRGSMPFSGSVRRSRRRSKPPTMFSASSWHTAPTPLCTT